MVTALNINALAGSAEVNKSVPAAGQDGGKAKPMNADEKRAQREAVNAGKAAKKAEATKKKAEKLAAEAEGGDATSGAAKQV